MKHNKLLANISRQFLNDKKVYRYRGKKVGDMTNDQAVLSCHYYCEENHLIDEWNSYREKAEAEYCYCSYLKQYIQSGLCYDLQMITDGLIKPSALPDIKVDKQTCVKYCSKCKYRL